MYRFKKSVERWRDPGWTGAVTRGPDCVTHVLRTSWWVLISVASDLSRKSELVSAFVGQLLSWDKGTLPVYVTDKGHIRRGYC